MRVRNFILDIQRATANSLTEGENGGNSFAVNQASTIDGLLDTPLHLKTQPLNIFQGFTIEHDPSDGDAARVDTQFYAQNINGAYTEESTVRDGKMFMSGALSPEQNILRSEGANIAVHTLMISEGQFEG